MKSNHWPSKMLCSALVALLTSISMGCSLVHNVASHGINHEIHVSVHGNDHNNGSRSSPVRTISAAALRAQPGDTITVHEGVYREQVDPPRGGTSDNQRIVYRAAPGEKVVIKGSEPVQGWEYVGRDTWKLRLSDQFFGTFNPFKDEIRGDWFSRKDRTVHTASVFLDDHWLTEAASLEDVLQPATEEPLWYTPSANPPGYLMNVAWFRVSGKATAIESLAAADFSDQRGIQTAESSEGGQCIGWIETGDWVRFQSVDFGQQATQVEFRAASQTKGGTIELRLDSPDGRLIGSCAVQSTGGWQKWKSFTAPIKPTHGIQKLCLVFRSADTPKPEAGVTTIWAQFKGLNPNLANVEISVRQSVFYPRSEGINFITVRGFSLKNAATNWAPPTAQQVGLIGTHWSKGWIIEDNDISYSACAGVTLGKYGDQWDNTSANSAEGYVKTIQRGLEHGWNRNNIGHHIVRNNTISHCEQAGIVGSLGAAFSTIIGNTIHDIHVRRLFTGAEMAAIKFHAAIDSVISHNHIYHCTRGIWLDWMAQGTRVSGNLMHDNGPREDLFLEVNHGPFLIDNNVSLSTGSLLINSQGGAFVHNLFAGQVRVLHTEGRLTPANQPHSTALAGLHPNPSGDDRYYNNLFAAGNGLAPYDAALLPTFMDGNVFMGKAQPAKNEIHAKVDVEFDPAIQLHQNGVGWYLDISLARAWLGTEPRKLVNTVLLANTATTDLPFELPDGTTYRLDSDFFNRPRNPDNPFPGPFEIPAGGRFALQLWPPQSLQKGLSRIQSQPEKAE
jgi:alpha-L-arabinofuranosidase